MSFVEYKEELRKIGLSEKQVGEVVKLGVRGLPIAINPTSLRCSPGNISIKFFNADGSESDGSEPVRDYLWAAEIDGVNSCQIKCLRIPELSYNGSGLLAVEVGIYPWEIKAGKIK